jgi:hypothetical protein
MSIFPTKNLIFLKNSKSNLNFLVDSGASISILPRSSLALPTGPHLVGANGKIVPVWGRRRQTVSFAGQDFEFDFFLAAVATPIIGMDFLAKFELSIIPAKQQVLHAASGCTLTKASTSSFVSPWSPETAAGVAALPPQVQKLLEEFPSLLRPSAAPPKPLHGVVHHICNVNIVHRAASMLYCTTVLYCTQPNAEREGALSSGIVLFGIAEKDPG